VLKDIFDVDFKEDLSTRYKVKVWSGISDDIKEGLKKATIHYLRASNINVIMY
jgi:hypothetical protein